MGDVGVKVDSDPSFSLQALAVIEALDIADRYNAGAGSLTAVLISVWCVHNMQITFCPNAIQWGDIATWFGGVATVFAVLTALGIALKDGFRQRREHRDRGRLVAAYLYQPFSEIKVILDVVSEEADRFAAVLPGSASIDVHSSAATLDVSCDRLSDLLRTFNLADVAFLPQSLGEDLARTVMMVNLLINGLRTSALQYLEAEKYENPDASRFEAGRGETNSSRLSCMASRRLVQFLNHCRNMFGEVVSG